MYRQGVTSRVLAAVLSALVVGSGLASVPGAAAQSASFDDVAPDNVHTPHIEGLDRLGVFEGTECGESLFCPQKPLPRWVMAVWMVRLLATGEPAKESGGSRFADVDADEWWVPYVERFDDLGITVGCDAGPPRRYCPDEFVSRGQMATFLARAFDLQSGAEAGFADVSGGVHAPQINALAASGITVGCDVGPPRRYCPDEFVSRGQMASFLKRARTAFMGPCPDAESQEATGGGDGGSGGGSGTSTGSGGSGPAGPGGPPQGPPPSLPAPVQPPPDAPQSLEVDPGEASLRVSWSPPDHSGPGVVGYRLRWKGPGQGYSDTDRSDATTALSYEITDLANGAKYDVQVAAGIRGIGFGGWSEASGTPRTVPHAPRSPRVSNGDEKLTVSWTAPAANGGAPVTGYRVEWSSDGVTLGEESATGLNHEIEDLTNGTDYVVRVAAVNAAGAGPWSVEAEGSPVGTPDAPQVVSTEPGDRSVTIEWSPPTDDGSSAITGYKVQWRSGTQEYSSSRQRGVAADVSEYEVTGLVNGTEYEVRVVAVNAVGDGEPSMGASATPATTPGPPRTVLVARGDASGTVAWSSPSAAGGKPVTGYVVQWSDDEFDQSVNEAQVAADVSEYEISGLVNGTEYEVRVVAVNAVGDGEPSQGASLTPATVPGAPADLDVARGVRSVTVSWGAPSDGGSAITAYRVQWRADDGDFEDSDTQASVAGGSLSRRITGLVNGTEYFVRVVAVNAVGEGPWSSVASSTPAVVPGPPQNVAVTPANGSVTATWQVPASTGGSPITSYKVQWRAESEGYDSGRQAAVTDLDDLSYEITGLSNGTKYFIRVVAVNAVGDGAAPKELAATPVTSPEAPGKVAAERGDRAVTATWEAADDGGSDITRYRVQWRAGDDKFKDSDSQATVGGSVSSRRITGLTNGTEYWVRVQATNSVGDGPWSASASAVAATVPGAPGSVVAGRGDRSITVTWQAPSATGGLAITAYKVQWRTEDETYGEEGREADVTDVTDLSYEITGLVNGTKYFVQVFAVNDAGDSAASAQRSATPATLPGAPDDVTLQTRDRSLDVSWEAADDGGSDITRYRVQWRAGDDKFKDSDSQATVGGSVSSRRITGLTNGTEYWVRVQATNSVGDGPWSASASAVAATVPGTPLSISAVPDDGSVTVSWQAPDDGGSDITGYLVEWRGADEKFSETERRLTTTDVSQQITGLTNGDEYSARVRAVNAAGTGPAATASATPRTVPAAPGDISITISTALVMLVSWDPPDDDGGSSITGYGVEWKGPDEEYSATERQATVTSPRHQISGLTKGEEYTLRIAARNVAGSGPAAEASAVVADPPGAPRSQTVTAHHGALEVSWQAPSDAGGSAITEYRVLWKGPGQNFDDSKCSFRRIRISASETLTAAIGELRNGTTYSIRVVAVNDSGPGAPLDFSGTPAAPSGLRLGPVASLRDRSLAVGRNQPRHIGSPATGNRVEWTGVERYYRASDRLATVGPTLRRTINGTRQGRRHESRSTRPRGRRPVRP